MVKGKSTEVNGGQFALMRGNWIQALSRRPRLHSFNNSQDNRRKALIRRNKIYDGFKSFNSNNLQAIRRIRRIRRKILCLRRIKFGFIRCN
jgi:hypothetical protein